MSTYKWDLIERLLHEVQNGEGSFAPRKYAEQEAAEKATAGDFNGDLDALKKTAADYEALLFKRGFIESLRGQGGKARTHFDAAGGPLLALIDSPPGYDHPRQVWTSRPTAGSGDVRVVASKRNRLSRLKLSIGNLALSQLTGADSYSWVIQLTGMESACTPTLLDEPSSKAWLRPACCAAQAFGGHRSGPWPVPDNRACWQAAILNCPLARPRSTSPATCALP